METLVEQRKCNRTQLNWPVSIWAPNANRFFNGQSGNISKTGAYLQVGLTTPVKAGQVLELNFPRTQILAEEKGSFARIKKAKVVRVDRQNILRNASIGVAVQFI